MSDEITNENDSQPTTENEKTSAEKVFDQVYNQHVAGLDDFDKPINLEQQIEDLKNSAPDIDIPDINTSTNVLISELTNIVTEANDKLATMIESYANLIPGINFENFDFKLTGSDFREPIQEQIDKIHNVVDQIQNIALTIAGMIDCVADPSGFKKVIETLKTPVMLPKVIMIALLSTGTKTCEEIIKRNKALMDYYRQKLDEIKNGVMSVVKTLTETLKEVPSKITTLTTTAANPQFGYSGIIVAPPSITFVTMQIFNFIKGVLATLDSLISALLDVVNVIIECGLCVLPIISPIMAIIQLIKSFQNKLSAAGDAAQIYSDKITKKYRDTGKTQDWMEDEDGREPGYEMP